MEGSYSSWFRSDSQDKWVNFANIPSFDNRKSVQTNFDCSGVVELYECDICEFKTDFKVVLTKHSEIHSFKPQIDATFGADITQYWCLNCDLQTFSKIFVIQHIKNNCRMRPYFAKKKLFGDVTLECIYCPYVDCLKVRLMSHYRLIHKPIKRTMFSCGFCDFKTNMKQIITQHHFVEHKPNKLLECKDCNYRTSVKIELKQHFTSCQKTKSNLLKCTVCDFKTRYDSALKRHLLTKHNIVMQVEKKCSKCSYKTKVKAKLTEHMKKHLLDIDPLKCKQCNFRATTRYFLKKHVHTKHRVIGKRWYECTYCGAEVGQRKHWNEHVLTKHSSMEVHHLITKIC